MIDYKLRDGQTVQLQITFARLKKLKEKDKKLYDDYNNAFKDSREVSKTGDFSWTAAIIYAAYRCTVIDADSYLTQDEFEELMPYNIGEAAEVAAALLGEQVA